MNRTLEHILPRVQKPARYTGGEYNAVVKDRRAVDVRYALCFPDTYEIGMSNLGVRILYGLMNEMDGVWCERVFAPWGDMEEEMRREGIPLYGLESGDSIADFDLIGFSLGYEMAYTNVLNMLDLAGLPLRSGERTATHCSYQLIRSVVFDLCVNVHRDFAAFMARQILYRFGVHRRMTQIGDVGVPQLMRCHFKIQAIYHMAVIPGFFSKFRVKHIFYILSVHKFSGHSRLCSPRHNILPQPLKLRVGQRFAIPV